MVIPVDADTALAQAELDELRARSSEGLTIAVRASTDQLTAGAAAVEAEKRAMETPVDIPVHVQSPNVPNLVNQLAGQGLSNDELSGALENLGYKQAEIQGWISELKASAAQAIDIPVEIDTTRAAASLADLDAHADTPVTKTVDADTSPAQAAVDGLVASVGAPVTQTVLADTTQAQVDVDRLGADASTPATKVVGADTAGAGGT